MEKVNGHAAEVPPLRLTSEKELREVVASVGDEPRPTPAMLELYARKGPLDGPPQSGETSLATMLDGVTLLDPGFVPTETGSVMGCSDAQPGSCEGCGLEALDACDGQGTVKAGGGFRKCPHRDVHEERFPRKWDPNTQSMVAPEGFIQLRGRL